MAAAAVRNLLSALLRAGCLDDLKSTFASAESSLGGAPGRASHSVLLHALVKDSELAATRKLLDEMANKKSKHRPTPDIVSYNTVLGGYSAHDNEEGFEKVLNEINTSKTSHSVLFHALVKDSELAATRKLLDEMANKKLKHRPTPNIVSYNTVLGGYSAHDNEEGFEKVLNEINTRKPDTLVDQGGGEL